MKNISLKNKVAVVTGGSRGIGKAISILLAENGVKIFICAREVEDLKKASDLIKKSGGVCKYMAADVSDESQVNRLVTEVMKIYRRVDVLVNNAGVGVHKPLIDSTLNDWKNVINTNLKGPFLCSKAFAPIMIKQKNGYIVNIASGAGKVGMKNLSIYCASKFGLIGLTESMQKELKQFGVKVLYLCPGYVKTTFFKNFPSSFHLPSYSKEPQDIAKELLKKLTYLRKSNSLYKEVFGRIFMRK